MSEDERRWIKPGTVVQHTSGGPKMVVAKFDNETGKFVCSWTEQGFRQTASYFFDELVQVEPGDTRDQGFGRG